MINLIAEGANGIFFPADIKEFWWGALAFCIVAGLLAWKLSPLVNNALTKAQQAAIAEATSAETALAQARAKVAAATSDLGDSNEQAEAIVAQAHQDAQQHRVDSAQRTQALINEMWAKAQSDVAAMKSQAHADIQTEVATRAVEAAEEVVRLSIDGDRHVELVDAYIASLNSSGGRP